VDEVMTDHQLQSTIDAALDELAEAQPGPHFVPRLRAHVEQSERAILPVRRAHIAVAAVVVLMLALVAGSRRRHDPPPAARVGQDVALASMPVPAFPAHPAPPALGVRSAQSARELRARAPEATEVPVVIVPSDQRGAVGRLFAALNAGEPEAVSMMRSVSTSNAGDAALAVAPIRIDPVIVSPVFDRQ
jgi:hypothetical protein